MDQLIQMKYKNINNSRIYYSIRVDIMGKTTKIGFIVIILLLAILTTGCLGKDEDCEDCGGTGGDPNTLFLMQCTTCDGDGKVGMFIDDEDFEDNLSYVIVFLIGVSIIASAIEKSRKKKHD